MGFFSSGRGFFSEPRITRIDLPEESPKSFKIKAAAAIMLAAAGVLALVWAVNGLLTKEPGWTEIQADSSGEPTCAGDFVLCYNAGADGSSPTTQIKSLTVLYNDAAVHAEKLFSATASDGNVRGLSLLNSNVNKPVALDKEAYDALLLLSEFKSREIFLAPVAEQYNTLFFSATDEEAESIDPAVNEQQRELMAEMAAFASDPEHIDIILEDGNSAVLRISDEYLGYARKNGIEKFVDLYWMKNAFTADYIADRLSAEGFSDGYLTCGDGFTRSLGGSGISLSSTVYDRVGKNIYKAASLGFGQVKSVVVFHDYPASRNNDTFYYQYSDGRMVTPYIAVQDGLCRTSVSNLTVCSDVRGCAEAMLAAKSAYISGKLPPAKLKKKLGESCAFAYSQDGTVFYSSEKIMIGDLLNDGTVAYTARIIEDKQEKK